MFLDRYEAGKKLSDKLEKFKDEDAIVFAIPRGGIETAYNSIKRFDFKWDLITPRKIGSPHNEEVAIGAVSVDGSYIVDEKIINWLNISDEYIKKQVDLEVKEIKRRLKEYRGNTELPDVRNKVTIVMDDGIATGYTLLAAIKTIKKLEPKRIVIAVPVAPAEIVDRLNKIVDEVICLLTPDDFYAVGAYYKNFPQVTDEKFFEIVNELKG